MAIPKKCGNKVVGIQYWTFHRWQSLADNTGPSIQLRHAPHPPPAKHDGLQILPNRPTNPPSSKTQSRQSDRRSQQTTYRLGIVRNFSSAGWNTIYVLPGYCCKYRAEDCTNESGRKVCDNDNCLCQFWMIAAWQIALPPSMATISICVRWRSFVW
jgi:hypothetical protein